MGPSAAHSSDERLNWTAIMLFWAAVAAYMAARAILGAETTPLLRDTDDAMRLVVVRDLLAGQGWFDHLQHRLNTPFGAEIHWSRLTDLPIAGLILVLRPLAGATTETLVAYIWPLAQLLTLLWLSAKITQRLVGPEGLLPALALPVLSPAVIAEFSPGRLDHHGVQILLMLGLVWCSLAALRQPRWAIGAGVIAATGLAVGTEAVPVIAAAVIGFGLLFVFRSDAAATLRAFGLSFAVAMLGHLALALPPERWLTPACDAISIVYVVVAIGIGAAYTLVSFAPIRSMSPVLRLAAMALAGAAVLGGVALLYPQCLRGPYAELDPWLVTHWLDRIAEARPIWTSALSAPALTAGFCIPPLLGLAALVWRLVRGGPANRDGWLMLGLFLLIAVAVMVVQVRGARMATPLAVPVAAWLIVAARQRYLASKRLGGVALLVGTWMAFAGVVPLLAVSGGLALSAPHESANGVSTAQTDDTEACLMPDAYADLGALPPERVMAPVDLGSHLLAFTRHDVVAAPYHRNQDGVRDAFVFFNGPLAEARAIAERRSIALVVTCAAMAEMQAGDDADPRALAPLLRGGPLPDWLTDVSLPGAALRVFAVAPASGQ